MFSGGIDSTVLAALTDRILLINEPIDLLNVAFFSEVSTPPADRQTGTNQKNDILILEKNYIDLGLEALMELNPSRQWNFVKVRKNILILIF